MVELQMKFASELLIQAYCFIEEVLVYLRLEIHGLFRVSSRVLEKPRSNTQHGFRLIGIELGTRTDQLGGVQTDCNSLSFCQLAKNFMSRYSQGVDSHGVLVGEVK